MEERIKWEIDPAHSNIEFKIKHLMITNVKGKFKVFDLDATTIDNDFTTAKIEFRIDPNSIDTNNDTRDNHLRSADFFDVQHYGDMMFRSTAVEKISDDIFKLTGELTIRGVTKPVVLEVEYEGSMIDPWGEQKAGFSIEGIINRHDWDINWNTPLEGGGWLVGDEVNINCEVQLKRIKKSA